MILGVNPSHDACFCLLDESGEPCFILEEERFNRIKHSGFSTTLSLEALLRDNLLDAHEVTEIAYSFEMDPEIEQALMEKCYDNVKRDFGPTIFREVSKYFHDPLHPYSPTQGIGLTTKLDDVLSNLRTMFPNARESSYMHHLSHAASAFYPSGFESAAVLVVDGAGKLETITTWRATESGLQKVKQIELPHSLGIFYWLCSNFIGLDEGQTMGLAAYGRPVYQNLIYDQILSITDDGDFSFKIPLVFWFDMDHEFATKILENVFGARPRGSGDEPLTQFHADIAASLQSVTEEILLKLAAHAQALTGEEHLCLAGGVIQNCVANGRLVNAKIFDEVWIQPMAHDAGTALGAALQRYHVLQTDRPTKRWRMTTVQLGRGYDPLEVEGYLKRLKIAYRECSSPAKEVAQWLAQGHTVGWMQGRAEVGPRALGGRSILADPRRKFHHFALNDIKERQPWRPFAPSILAEAAYEYIDSASDSPFMILSFPVSDRACREVPAVCHVDGTARIQTVSQEDDPSYRAIIESFKDLTGVPLILNTSFNQRSEPIVQHTLDAVRNFLVSGIDRLMIERWALDEKPVLNPLLLESLGQTRFVSIYEHYLRNCTNTILVNHDEFTARQGDRKIHLQAILDWLGIEYRNIQAADLGAALEAFIGVEANIIGVSAYLDEKILRGLRPEIRAKLNIFVLDGAMFMVRTSVTNFLQRMAVVRKEIIELAGGREVFIWVESDQIAEFDHCLKHLDLKLAGVVGGSASQKLRQDIQLSAPSFLKGRALTTFVVASFSIVDKFKANFREFGFRAGVDYIVFDC
ncbi:MAG TPA: carbamoyltransferase C-terminal domain-containing protein [Pyrinomonadaceae bacterium]|jgi:predicted NodU family carbamoyl transferase|nr:carbamoyltransferase C-terminal domain-containing protein [Pyrinomonadaceae bacterium]